MQGFNAAGPQRFCDGCRRNDAGTFRLEYVILDWLVTRLGKVRAAVQDKHSLMGHRKQRHCYEVASAGAASLIRPARDS